MVNKLFFYYFNFVLHYQHINICFFIKCAVSLYFFKLTGDMDTCSNYKGNTNPLGGARGIFKSVGFMLL